eukprot:XP_001708195.1 Hypothetical protein GL50803_98366 [Giardia lamblia ATCC 50803]
MRSMGACYELVDGRHRGEEDPLIQGADRGQGLSRGGASEAADTSAAADALGGDCMDDGGPALRG